MNSPRAIEQEIQSLIDGHLSEDEERRLVDHLAKDPELIDLLVSYTGLDIAISKALRFSPENFRDVQSAVNRGRPKPLGRVIIASAAVMAILLTVLWLVIPPAAPPHVVLHGAPGTNYEIERATGSHDKGSLSGLFTGDGVVMTQGVMKLDFASGVHVILQGPAELRVEKEHLVRLVEGKARFRVPPTMSGFRVVTKDVRAIDLGTEFAIEVMDDGPDEVHVIEGRVDVSPIGNPQRGEVVEGGLARSMVNHGLPQSIPYEGPEFLDSLPAGLPYLHMPMEMDADGELVVLGNIKGEIGVHGRFVSSGVDRDQSGNVEGRFGAALGFDGVGDHVITDWMGIRGDDPRTVAFWAKVAPGEARYDTACLVWGHRPLGKETTNQKWNVQIARNRGSRTRCILNTTFGGLWMEGSTLLDDGQWHHVAAVYAGRNRSDGMPDLRLYVDGRSEPGTWVSNQPIDRSDGQIRVRTDGREEIGAHPLTLARTIQPKPAKPHFFKGQLDELYVFAGVLRPEDIHSLWQHNRFDPPPSIQKAALEND